MYLPTYLVRLLKLPSLYFSPLYIKTWIMKRSSSIQHWYLACLRIAELWILKDNLSTAIREDRSG
jgi:hypothetical protein